jgi:hypothetical protein
MKRMAFLPLMGALALGACSDAAGPSAPRFELVDTEIRVASADVNAHVYGSFSIQITGQPGVIGFGDAANFPGNPKNAGTCGLADGTDTGVWYNPQNRRTSGSESRPHPHCVSTEGGASMLIVLEPISAENGNIGENDEFLRFTAREGQGVGFNYDGVRITGGGRNTDAQGVLEAYAIDASTLGTTNQRVGILTIYLEQFILDGTNLFTESCTITGVAGSPRCLDTVIMADYKPLDAPDGVGTAITSTKDANGLPVSGGVSGFLYWSSATSPFNYSDMDS